MKEDIILNESDLTFLERQRNKQMNFARMKMCQTRIFCWSPLNRSNWDRSHNHNYWIYLINSNHHFAYVTIL